MKFLRLSCCALGLTSCLFFQIKPRNYGLAQTFDRKQAELKLLEFLEPAKLSEDQKKAILTLNASTIDRLGVILTPTQKEQLENNIQKGMTLKEAIGKIALSDNQQKEVELVLQDIRSGLNQILTAEQRRVLRQQYRENR